MPKTIISWKSIWICLKSQIEFWNLKIQFQSEKVLSCLKTLFPTWILWSAAMCVYSSLSSDKVEYTHIEPLCQVHVLINFQTRIFFFRFKSKFQISKLVLRFQIHSNKFSRHRGFQHFWSIDKIIHPRFQIWESFT